MLNSCPHTVAAASYLLGVLRPAESEEFGRHAEDCPYCRREIVELRPVTRVLGEVKAQARP
ncbi:hypothetical protein [Amycolatopsis alkalitolerans]|uniref:Zinc-finger domain-containing protein n=1 Tax=Amycolatopsis alkalitolerans TaxID=2547244 RepID=A0A5C4M3E2_9PSEU|nr:hypothetical protein [Amycolatopsis alkalitolerans]TNC26896.1 hypothetical protein FG385_10690 [Amycolatopsis alkalitolerans]